MESLQTTLLSTSVSTRNQPVRSSSGAMCAGHRARPGRRDGAPARRPGGGHQRRQARRRQPGTIALEYTDGGVELRVENGFPDAEADEHSDTAGGYGLAGMHERLRLINGELKAGRVGDRWVVQARVKR